MHELVEQIRDVIKEAGDGNTYECVNIASTEDPNIWVQITWNMLNVSYPTNEDPMEHVGSLGLTLPKDAGLFEWEPDSHATWEHGSTDPEGVAAFAFAYLEVVYGSSGSPENLCFERQAL